MFVAFAKTKNCLPKILQKLLPRLRKLRLLAVMGWFNFPVWIQLVLFLRQFQLMQILFLSPMSGVIYL